MNHQIRGIYRTIDDLTDQMDYLRDLIAIRDYNPLNYSDNPFRHTSFNNPYSLRRDPLFNPSIHTPPIHNTPPLFPIPPTNNRTRQRNTPINRGSPSPVTVNATTNTRPTSSWSRVPYSENTTEHRQPREAREAREPREPQLFEVVFNRTFTFPGEEETVVTHKMVNENTELEVFDSSSTTETLQCSICRANFENGDIIRKICSCNHKFHQECVDKWFEDKDTCPVCRTKLQPEEEHNYNNNPNTNENVTTNQIPLSQTSENIRNLLRDLRQRYNLPDSTLPSR